MNVIENNRALGIRRIVIWGLKTSYDDTYRFIHLGFFSTLKKLGVPVIWVDDILSNQPSIGEGDLIISSNRSMQFMPISPKIKYCLHNPEQKYRDQLNLDQYVLLQVMTNERFIEKKTLNTEVNFRLRGLASYDSKCNVLHQSWGTPLLESEFYKPIDFPLKKSEYFVGTIWDNDLGQGNEKIIPIYKSALKREGINFYHVKGAPEALNPTYIRHSAIGTSIVGNWQRENGYTPCRLFKSVSYGRLGSINSILTKNQYPWVVANENIDELVDHILSKSRKEIIELISFQQEHLSEETYDCKIQNIQTVLLSKLSY